MPSSPQVPRRFRVVDQGAHMAPKWTGKRIKALEVSWDHGPWGPGALWGGTGVCILGAEDGGQRVKCDYLVPWQLFQELGGTVGGFVSWEHVPFLILYAWAAHWVSTSPPRR
jgi:hypothetical protein